MIKEVDENASGCIDFDEFCIMMEKQEQTALPEEEVLFSYCTHEYY